MKSAWVIAAVMITVLVMPSCAVAAGLTTPEMVFSAPGQELASNITLDQASGSISGYDITLTLEPGGVADITRIEYPVWAVITQTSDLPGGTVRIRAANIQETAIPTSGSVELARIYAVSLAAGTVTPEIVEAVVDDFAGNRVVTVTPVGTVPPVSGGENGLGSISYTGPEVTGGTVIPTGTTSVTAASPVTTGGTAAGASGIINSPTETDTIGELPTGNVIEAAPSTPTTLPTTIPGPGPVTIILAGVFTAILATGWIKRD